MHPRLTIYERVFEGPTGLAEDVDQFAAAGADRVGLAARKIVEVGWDDAAARVERHGIAVTHVGNGALLPLDDETGFAAANERAKETIDGALRLGAGCVYGPSGAAPSLTWEAAAERFVAGVAPMADYARGQGMPLLIEPTEPRFAHICFLRTLADTTEIAERAGIGVCLDIQHTWTDRNLRDGIRRAMPLVGLVQLSDWSPPGTQRYVRGIPGDGIIPLERILGWILEAGYTGFFDCELSEEPGIAVRDTVARAIDATSTLLERVGA